MTYHADKDGPLCRTRLYSLYSVPVGTMFVYVIFILLLLNAARSSENDTFSVLDRLKSGLKLASKLLVSDHANGVASLVSEAFEKTDSKLNSGEKSNNVFSGFLRILGFDAKKIGAITVNAIIFIAQLISSSVSLKPPSHITEARKYDKESLFEWIIKNEAIADIISNAKDENLSESVIEYVKERSLDEETGCIQLLICKSSPFIRQMQKSINERANASTRGSKALFEYLPNINEVSDNGDICERKYPYCSLPLQ